LNLLRISFGNAARNILRNKLISLLCLGIIAFTLLIYGIFEYVSFSLDRVTREFSRSIEAIFYFKDGSDRQATEAVIRRVKESLLVQKVVYKSKEQANIQFGRQFPELKHILKEFNRSPFPASMEITFKPEYTLDTKITAFIEELERLDPVESKQVNIEWAQKIITVKKFISLVGLFLSSILLFVSVFIIYNVIKLNILFRGEEIHIQKLVGATNWYIKFPFIIEGAVLGFSGSVVAGLFLFGLLKLFPTYAAFMFELFKGMVNFQTVPPALFVRLVLLGTGIGLFSSFFSTRRFLRQ